MSHVLWPRVSAAGRIETSMARNTWNECAEGWLNGWRTMIVLDTSVLIDHLRRKEQAVQALDRMNTAGERLTASVMSKVELLAGMRPSEMQVTYTLMSAISWIDVDDDIAERAGMYANQYLRSHPGIDPVDYVVAATAARLGATLWTRNVKHFPMFQGLASPY